MLGEELAEPLDQGAADRRGHSPPLEEGAAGPLDGVVHGRASLHAIEVRRSPLMGEVVVFVPRRRVDIDAAGAGRPGGQVGELGATGMVVMVLMGAPSVSDDVQLGTDGVVLEPARVEAADVDHGGGAEVEVAHHFSDGRPHQETMA